MFKKFTALVIAAVMLFSLSGCGVTAGVQIKETESQIYSKEDIDSAIAVILNYFRDNFDGCVLREIGYAGDEYLDEMKEWQDTYSADEVIILMSSFYVISDTEGSLVQGETYTGWNWILSRDTGGRWIHRDHGYG